MTTVATGKALQGEWEAQITCYAAPIGYTHCTEAVVGHSSNLSCTPRAVVVAIFHIRVGHGVRVVRVEVIATLWALKY